ncbi:MAG TPA: TIGR03084 family metal-binding protein [Dehalococcoidia bacterium]|nr:TIGR03084 family metal-binding protein [Dehalococcoidia bacterium]
MTREELASVIDDLAAEQAVVLGAISGLDADTWDRPTAAEGWTLRDCVAHLAETDESATDAVLRIERPRNARERQGVLTPGQIAARRKAGSEVAAWYEDATQRLIEALRRLAPDARPAWLGRPMGASSFISARIMEHWSHGLDILEAAGVEAVDSDRLRHVAHLGYITRDFAFRNRGLTPPEEPFYLELTAPSGETWTWGPAEAQQRIIGSAGDFCRVVTQRIHPADTQLEATGEDAREFLTIAQAFAGPPGQGRPRKGTSD